MRILLLRHAETDWNCQGRCQGVTDLDLNERGKRQAAEIAESLSGGPVDAIYSSDLKRALQTADALRRFHPVGVRVDSDLRELNHGEFEGLTFPLIRSSYPGFIERWRSEPAEVLIPGGERLVDVAARAWRAVERIARSHLAQEQVVVVSHQFPISAVLCRITGTSLNRYRSFHLEPCGLKQIEYDYGARWVLLQVDGTWDVGQNTAKRRSVF